MNKIGNNHVTSTGKPKKAGLRWGIILMLLLGAVVNYLDRSNLSIANTTIAAEFGLSSTQMGLLLSAFLWPYALANLPAGWLVDRFGPKKMFAWASGLWSVATIISAFVNTYSLLYAMRMLLGVSESPFFTSGLKVTERWFAKSERGLPTSIINTGSQIANAIAPPLLTVLMLTMTWRGMFIFVGAMGLIIMLIWLKVYRDPTFAEKQAITQNDMAADVVPAAESDAAQSETQAPTAKWSSLFKNSSTWFMIIGNFGIMFTIWVYLTWLPSYLEKEQGFTLKETGWIASIPFVAGIIGVLLGGFISDYFIRKGVAPVTSRKIPIVGGAILAAASVAPIPFIDNTVVSIVLLSVGYFASQLPSGVIWTLAADIAPGEQVASLGAIQNFGGFLGAALAPIATGYILDTTGSFNNVFLLGASLLVMGAISYGVFLKKPITRTT
ncbi:MFS transporter [Paenibacillus peoriae]|uniref:MFS transporter n=1 Tax=Paenibacillus TaxID=44249 RepID=UPI0008FC6B51|nr:MULTISPECIES: MFS transporter [Paenibacillus]APB73062.1 MFS transporter [Paenibacillus polymyxa]OMF44086.1 MFS transporter [Paenibacillus peoriae]PPQ48615.1 MFS transporter [Paenibacillus peoriae]QYK59973.1 putative L-galactonate transporter [Paenibacillus sp. S25]